MAISDIVRRNPALRTVLAGPRFIRRQTRAILRRQAHEALDRLSEWSEDDIVLRAPQFEGRFAINPSSDLCRRLLLDGHYEPELVETFCRHLRHDRDFVDVGANVGFFTVLGAKRLSTGRVLAVEPTAGAARRLRRNIEMNQVADKVTVFEGLISNVSGESTINVIAGREEYSSIGGIVHPSANGQASAAHVMPSLTLDGLMSRFQISPGFIKVDVEGAEGLVFSESDTTLSEHRPVVLSELSNALLRPMGFRGVDIVEIFRRKDYRVLDPLDPKGVPGVKEFGDILCIPREFSASM